MIEYKDIIEMVSMEELLNYYGIQRDRAGRYRCPFHDDKNPSAGIDKNGWFHCFACGANYNVIGFVAAYEACSKANAITLLNAMFDLKLDSSMSLEERHRIRQRKIDRENERQKLLCNKELALQIIASEICAWKKIQKDSHPTRGQIKKDEWKAERLFFYSLKQQEWLEWLDSKVRGYYTETIFDDMYDVPNKDLVERIIKDKTFLYL